MIKIYKCRVCASEFYENNEFKIKRTLLSCPGCRSNLVRYKFRNDYYVCIKCGTIFAEKGEILKKTENL